MKKIINGRTANTETARLLGDWENNANPSDFDYMRERLYRTKSGVYFIHGEGGARTEYASERGDGWRGYGEDIRLVSEGEAKKWAERRLTDGEYAAIFAAPEL